MYTIYVYTHIWWKRIIGRVHVCPVLRDVRRKSERNSANHDLNEKRWLYKGCSDDKGVVIGTEY